MPPRAATLPLLLIDGSWDEAWELAETTRADGSPLERHMAVMILGELARMTGDRRLAWDMVGELLPRGPASEPEDGLFPYSIEMLRLAARLALDEADARSARDWIDAHDHWMTWSGAFRGCAESELLKAWLALSENELDTARTHSTESLQLATEPRQPIVLMECREMLGMIEHRAGNLDAARAHLEEARTLATACEMPYQRARILLQLSDVAEQSGDDDRASTLRAEAEPIARELKSAPLLARLDQQVPPPAPRNGALGDLTARETEVLRLVAQGYTDAAVAEELFISPRTVGQHLRSIYNKLDVPSRAAATRRAVEAELI